MEPERPTSRGPRSTRAPSGGIPISPGVVLAERELRWRFSRASGPGGQSVNTADSRVELSVDLTACPSLPPWLLARARERLAGRLAAGVLTVVASEHRSQLANRQAARARLAELLREATAPPPPRRRPSRPSRGAVERRLAGKRVRAKVKRERSRPDPGAG